MKTPNFTIHEFTLSAEESPTGLPMKYGYMEPVDEDGDQEGQDDCQPFCMEDALAPDGHFDKEAADRVDRENLLLALRQQVNRLQAGYAQSFTNLEGTQSDLSSENVSNVQAEKAAILAEKGLNRHFSTMGLMRELYFLREHRPCNHLLELVLMLCRAYSLIYGLFGNSRNSAYGRRILQGTKLEVLEYGDFLLTEFDRFIDAFESGLSDIQRFYALPNSCAVPPSTYLALLFTLARTLGYSADGGWHRNLKIARDFLLESTDFTYPAKWPESQLCREALLSHQLSAPSTVEDIKRQEYVRIGLILRRWESVFSLGQKTDFSFSFDAPYPQLVFFDGDDWTQRVPDDLRLIAGLCARCFGAGMGERLNEPDYPYEW